MESINKFKDQMKEALDEVKAALTKSKDKMARYYDQRCTPVPDYQPRDKVSLTQVTSKPLDHPQNCLIVVWVLSK
jgi:hypothetical protein